MLKSLLGQGETDQTTPVLGHEVDRFRRDLFGGQHEVAFVFTVFVVDDDDHAPVADFVNGAGDIRKWRLGRHHQEL